MKTQLNVLAVAATPALASVAMTDAGMTTTVRDAWQGVKASSRGLVAMGSSSCDMDYPRMDGEMMGGAPNDQWRSGEAPRLGAERSSERR